jgi:hypothetical protein
MNVRECFENVKYFVLRTRHWTFGYCRNKELLDQLNNGQVLRKYRGVYQLDDVARTEMYLAYYCFLDHLTTLLHEHWNLALRTREVSGAYLGPETSYPEIVVIFLSPSRQVSSVNLKSDQERFLPQPSNSLFINLPAIRRYCVWATDSVVKSQVH